jgi:large repetitive protein
MPAGPNTIPAIRTFQFDSTSIGSLATAVNLFRGDVNIPQNLFTLPGRRSGSGMDLNVTILYQSNVFRQAVLWNRDAPTGVLGLGWSLPLTYIQAIDNGSPDPDTRTYVLSDNGNPNQLVRQPQQHFLFTIRATIANTLQNGQPVAQQVRALFLQHGLPLDPGATASGAAGAWILSDDVLQQLFSIQTSPSDSSLCDVCYGGQSFQLQNYRFWQIVYFPTYERWLIVTDDGIRKSFGGMSPKTTEGYCTSNGNSIAWEVWWAVNGIPVWTGPSSLTTGQVQVARAWYLECTSDRFGDKIVYEYNGWARNANGLIPDVEQQVGVGGLPYTKAVYLTQVTDVFGRTAVFKYCNKDWNQSGKREYSDPHRAIPSNDPNAYQDLYETKFLRNIFLSAANGALLYKVQLGSNVTNITSYQGELYYDTYKRYLTSLTLINAAGDSLPGYKYGYYWQPTESGAQPGALMQVTAPQGGTITYTYTNQPLPICQRSQPVIRPTQAPNGVPRVFYGDDYMVSLWYDAPNNLLTLQVYTWVGRWISWQLDSSDPTLYTGGFSPETIGVLANSEFFVVYFNTSSDSLAWVFSKNPAQQGQFVAAEIAGVQTAVNVPTLTIPLPAGMVTYCGGDTFFAAAQMNPSGTSQYQILTWRWFNQSWERQTVTPAQPTWLAAAGEYLLAVDWVGNVNLSYLDGTLAWQTSPGATIEGFAVPGSNYENVVLVPGTGMAALNLLEDSGSLRVYQIYAIQWDAQHTLLPVVASQPIQEPVAPNGPGLGWLPAIVANSLIAVNGNLLRFNGANWLVNTNLAVQHPESRSTQWYAYGPDYALQVVTNSQGYGASANVLGFDPNVDSSAWTTTPASPPLPVYQYPYDNWPSGGNPDYALLGPDLYFRGTATDWTTVASQSTPTNIATLAGTGFNSQSLINEGPAFLSYAVVSAESPTVQSIVLQNGQVMPGPPVPLPKQQIYTPSIEGPAGPGSSPQGPSVFVTYDATASAFDQAGTIYLNHYAGDAVTGPIEHYPVTSVAVDNGFQEISPTTYYPDPSQAACDATGLIVKYYQNTVCPGTADISQLIYGRTISSYLNGVTIPAGNYYDMLDGLLESTATYDSSGKLLESRTNHWQVVRQIASDPANPNAPPIALRGGWIMRTQQVSVVDGVNRTVVSSFAAPGFPGPYSGRPVARSSESYDGSGNPQTFVQAHTYGPEVSVAMRALNMRSWVAQTITSEQPGSASAIAMKSSASAISLWPSAAGEGVQAPAKEAAFTLLNPPDPAFPFASYKPGTTPGGWVLERRVTARTLIGQQAESVDACGTAGSILYSKDLAFAVMSVSNAGLSGAAYLGFEPYEDQSAWTLTNTQLNTDNARTGTTSLVLPGGAAAQVSVSITKPSPSQVYVIGIWYKTAAGFTPAAGARCMIASDGNSNSAQFQQTNGKWTLLTVPVTASGSNPVKAALTNSTPADIVLDSVYVVPLVGGMIARTFDVESQLITSAADAAGRTRWSFYDSFFRPSLQVGPNGQPKELAQRFLSRQSNSSDTFDIASPNAEVTVHPADGGSLETFLDGGAWQQAWRPTNPSAWQASGGSVQHTGTSADTLAYQGSLPPTWAVYFEVEVGSETPVLSLSAGSVSIGYSATGYTGWSGAQPLASPGQMARHWLLIWGDGVVLFFGDGQLLFSAPAPAVARAPTITTSADLTFSHLAFMAAPRVSLSYNDGSSRQRQIHQLYGADSRVSAVIFDPLDRKVATTRVAPGSFGSGVSLPVLKYRAGFVNIPGFLAAISSSWKMSGDVAEYYQGQVVNGIQRSNDQDYPYRGALWEASARRRKIETGLPGLPYAIHDIGSTTPAQRATTQYAYGSNSGKNPGLPEGEYSQTTVTTPVKAVALRVNDKTGQSVSSVELGTGGTPVAQSAGLRSYTQTSDGPQITLDLQLPNAIIPGPQSGDAAYVRTTVTDAANQAVAARDPDSGQTQFLYDPCGRVRFVEPALATGEQWFYYTRYDAIGRVVEQGTVPQAWDPVTLGPLAAQSDWPTSDVPHTVSLTLAYDGDGTDPTQIGQKISCVTTTPGEIPCVATESYSYDASGQLTGVALTISGPASASGTVAYAYNNLGEMTILTLPSDAPLAQVTYTLNDQGWITGIGSKSSSDIAAYTYTMDGSVETETLGGAWTRQMQYTSGGWAQQVVAKSAGGQGLTLAYTYNPDSTVATRSIKYAFANAEAVLSDTYSYDSQGCLAGAAGSSDEQISSYDPNGNILALTQAGKSQSFTQAAGSDQVQRANIDGSISAVIYDARGRMKSSLGRTFTYDDATNLTVTASTNTQQVQFGYGSRRQRVLKAVSGKTLGVTFYFTGSSAAPVARLDGNKWSAFVYGPTGLVAAFSDQAYYPLKDNELNVWAVVNQAGLVARYVYLPFGGLVTADGPNPQVLPYLYMGQEWDAELSLYNFRDRMYDPLLRRYLSPDPARQFPSPYLFCANNPLSVTDSTGDLAFWARFVIGAEMFWLAIAGIVATILTAGAAAPEVAAGEAGLAAAETGGTVAAAGAESAAAGAVEGAAAGGAAAAEGGAGAAAEGGAAAAGEVGAGAASGAAEGAGAGAASSTIGSNVGYFALQSGLGLVEGVGTSGLQYDIQNGRTFTAKGFFESIGWGALSGVVGGALGGIPGMSALSGTMNTLRPLTQFGINVLAQGVAGAAASDITQILANVSATGPDRPAWYSGLLLSTVVGAGTSAVIGGITSGVAARVEIGNQLGEIGSDLKTIGNQTLERASSALETVQAAARTDDGMMIAGTAAFFVVAGFGVWGATESSSPR